MDRIIRRLDPGYGIQRYIISQNFIYSIPRDMLGLENRPLRAGKRKRSSRFIKYIFVFILDTVIYNGNNSVTYSTLIRYTT